MLEVKNLKIQFLNNETIVNAVNGIDFTINENEVVGLVGASGSGKTVTALSIMRLLSEDNSRVTGEIIFSGAGGEKINLLLLNAPGIRKIRASEIAMIFQEPFTSLNPVLRIGEQIEEVLLAHRRVKKEELKNQVLRLLEKVSLKGAERIYSGYPHQLSGGERQRVMIAMAIALNPKLLIADEPTTALDVTIQAEILDLLLKLKDEQKMSLLFITHDFGIIKKIADRVLVMTGGRIVESGLKKDMLQTPKNAYTKKLIDAVPRMPDLPESPLIGKPQIEEKSIATGKTAMTVQNLNKTFIIRKGFFKNRSDVVEAVKSVSFQIKQSKTLGLVGESGSGKTTLAKLLVGLLDADSGKIENVDACSDVQIVFQDPYNSLDSRMRMRDIVLEGPKVRGVERKERERILKDVLFKVHLNYADRLKYPHQFSGGERQRIAIARAIAVRPQILILDEPVSSLDVIIQAEVLRLLKELQKELKLTYVFISHDLRVVEYMSDDVAVMQNGEIVELASKNEIYFSSKHPYTKRLISSVFE
ncbi:MAG: ABC transporter ATP-binding protein [Candidatus Omnitrophota bacterium]